MVNSMKQSNIDFTFIHRLEGGSLTKAYVPDVNNSQSGVTVGAGFDLGARNVNDLKALGLESALIDKLHPYLGLKRLEAAAFLNGQPLEISPEQAEAIDISVKKNIVERLISRFDQVSAIEFCHIPSSWQTVIASVEFQYGSVKTKCPNFWGLVTSHRWNEAQHELRNFDDSYATRRNQEADYIDAN
ncbi:MAG: hypothetical protein ACI97K_000213 [Glaciecola sp.]|jgi:hypothetical protein